MKWILICKLEDGGHRLFKADDGAPALRYATALRYAIADNSGNTPDRTEDGILWLDFDSPILIGADGHASVPLSTPGGGKHTLVGSVAAAELIKRFPTWRVKVSPKLWPLIATLTERCIVRTTGGTDVAPVEVA